MKILVIDYLSYVGHRMFNSIHIPILLNKGHEVHLIGSNGHFEDYRNYKNVKIYNIDKFFSRHPKDNSLWSRIRLIMSLLVIRMKFKVDNYDVIIFPTYDILSLFIFRTKKKTLLFNHNNVQQLDDRVKLLITKLLPHHYIHVAINRDMKSRLEELLPKRKVVFIPHGIPLKKKTVLKPNFLEKNDKFLFCPANINVNKLDLKGLLNSQETMFCLEKNGLVLYIKKSLIDSSTCSSIKVLSKQIDDAEYDYMLSNAKAVLLPYDESFKYRCSGILFECIAFHTPIITTKIDTFKEYEGDIDIYYYSNASELSDAIEIILNKKKGTFKYDNEMIVKYWDLALL